ncbi:hypothetical protein I546_0707 [Mycobacterium kansasii 732]|nr:hypothetical protein I546_0707 [Mycobacterium kansasii 732]
MASMRLCAFAESARAVDPTTTADVSRECQEPEARPTRTQAERRQCAGALLAGPVPT